MSPNDADGMANSVDPDQTAPLGAVWSGSALIAQAYLSENLGSLRYQSFFIEIESENWHGVNLLACWLKSGWVAGLTDWMTDQLIEWLIDLVIDWLRLNIPDNREAS